MSVSNASAPDPPAPYRRLFITTVLMNDNDYHTRALLRPDIAAIERLEPHGCWGMPHGRQGRAIPMHRARARSASSRSASCHGCRWGYLWALGGIHRRQRSLPSPQPVDSQNRWFASQRSSTFGWLFPWRRMKNIVKLLRRVIRVLAYCGFSTVAHSHKLRRRKFWRHKPSICKSTGCTTSDLRCPPPTDRNRLGQS